MSNEIGVMDVCSEEFVGVGYESVAEAKEVVEACKSPEDYVVVESVASSTTGYTVYTPTVEQKTLWRRV